MIKIISWEEIKHIWHFHLWPERISAIEPTSAMNYLKGYDIKNMGAGPTFFGYFMNQSLVGVNSGHRCADNSYRSRGLWVNEQNRGDGIGKKLLLATIQQGRNEMTEFIWSYPRKTSWFVYKSVGFIRTSHWSKSETSEANAFCILR